MKFRNLLAATAAVSLAAAPAIANAAPAANLEAAPVADESQFGGDSDSTGMILAGLAAILIMIGIIVAIDNEEDEPVSP